MHDKDRKNQGTTRDAGYHDVNFVRGMGDKENDQESDFVALTEAITL